MDSTEEYRKEGQKSYLFFLFFQSPLLLKDSFGSSAGDCHIPV